VQLRIEQALGFEQGETRDPALPRRSDTPRALGHEAAAMTAAANVTISPDWRESATHLPPAIESRPPRPVPAAAAAHPLPAAAPRPPAKGAAVPVPSKLHVVSASMLRAMCPHANDAGIIDVLRDIHTDSILLGAILCARLVSACDRIVQLTQLAPEELSANLLICVVLAEKLLNDAPFNDLVGMIAAALSCSPDALCQLEFRVLSILSVHEGTIVGGEQLVFFTKAAMQTNWARMHGAECISWLKVRAARGSPGRCARGAGSPRGSRAAADLRGTPSPPRRTLRSPFAPRRQLATAVASARPTAGKRSRPRRSRPRRARPARRSPESSWPSAGRCARAEAVSAA
jgi:hypothetical protein